ncbi:MAG: 16S rRNA (cytosine(1402)-N(4))-methyltransferase RsmH [Gammaproteobacteria bacterium]
MGAREDQHEPVLLDAVLEHLNLSAEGVYVDGTFGRGGHSRAMLERLGPEGSLVVIDRDPQAIEVAERLAAEDSRVTVIRGSFGEIGHCLEAHGLSGKVDGILVDLGVSSPQLDDAQRGFSFMRDGPLDMRMDPDAGLSAEGWLNTAAESEMARVIARFGEEPAARRIARAICKQREQERISRTRQLAELIESVIPRRGKGKHPATRTFQAVRMHINNELGELQSFLDAVVEVLSVGGRLCVISFHSLEDRMVKRFLRDHSRVDPALAGLPVVPESAQPDMRLIGKALQANAAEVEQNPRARSAVLRTGERVS